MGYDVVIRGAQVVDGTGAASRRSDVAIVDGRIVQVASLPEDVDARRTIDARGGVLAPGFIDIHTHSDATMLKHGTGINKLAQGVTTEVTGNCGFSAFPIAGERRQLHEEHLACVGPDTAELPWRDFVGYADALRQAEPIQNVACLVGHGTLRVAVNGLSADAYTEDQRDQLGRLLEDALEQGAFGFTSGLTYSPSMFATTDELIELGKIAARHAGIYATHARAGRNRELAAIGEAVTVGRESGVRVEYSHLALNDPDMWGAADRSLALFDDARHAGIDIAFDVYPYDASQSSISQYLPEWLVTVSVQAAREMLTDASIRARALTDLAKGFYGGIPWMWDRVLVTQTGASDDPYTGSTLAEISERDGRDPGEIYLELFERYGNGAQVALFYRTEADMMAFLRHPAAVVGSDGLAMPEESLSSRPHPRFYGTFPRVLGRYARDKALFSLEEAVRKMTGDPADRLGLSNRGYLKPDYAADLVLFSREEIEDTATFAKSNQLPIGIELVMLNGEIEFENGSWNGACAGQVLLHQ